MQISKSAKLTLVLLVILLSGCYTPFPVMKDPLLGLPATRGSADQNLSEIRGKQLALILSDNTKNIIAWQKEARQQQSESIMAAIAVTAENRKAADANLDAGNIVVRVSGILKSKFPNIVVSSDIATAEKNPGAAVIFDLQIKNEFESGFMQHKITETWTAALYFLRTDGSRVMIKEVVARKTGSVTGGGNELVRLIHALEAQLRNEVFDDLDAQLTAALR